MMKAAPSFFKFFITGNSIDMKIPKAFTCRMKQVLPKKVLLRDRYNNVWTVKVAKVGECWYFVDGWDKFVEDCLLTIGDFMVFKYFGDSVFNVKVYGPSATEKRPSMRNNVHVDDHEEETESKSCDYVFMSRDDVDNVGSDDTLCIPMKPRENECQEVVHGRDDDDSDDEFDDYDDGDDSDYIPLKSRQNKRRKVVQRRDDNEDDDHGFDDDDSDDKDYIPLKSRQNEGRKAVQRRYDDDDSDDSDYIQMKPRENEHREVMQRQVNNVGAGVSRNKRDQTTNLFPKWYGMEIFEAGLAQRPKNPYFVAKIMPKRRSSMFIPTDVIKDYKLDLERGIILVDPNGRKFHTKCKKWKNGRWILSGGWRSLCTMNFIALEDTCICEFIQTEGHMKLFLRISFVRTNT